MAMQAAVAVLASVHWMRRPRSDSAVEGRSAAGPDAQRATEWLCAERAGHRPLALMAVRPDQRQAWVLAGAAERLAEETLPPMRTAPLGVAVVLAAASTTWAPLAVAALAYAGWLASRRALLRHQLRTEIDAALRRSLLAVASC
jgi:hypothetical protein